MSGWILYVVNEVLGDGVGFGLLHPLRKVVHMGPPREWATKLVGAVGPCGQLSDHSHPSGIRNLRKNVGWRCSLACHLAVKNQTPARSNI